MRGGVHIAADPVVKAVQDVIRVLSNPHDSRR